MTPDEKMQKITPDEVIVSCISRQIEDRELVGQGIATPLVAAGFLLAKLTHAPNLVFASAIGQSICQGWAPLGVATIEQLWISQGMKPLSFVDIACGFLPYYSPKEFFRPGQIDPYGNFNNVYIGGSYRRPRLRLPGVGGIPDATVHGERIYLYVPRHGRHTFVENVDFCSGLGHHPNRMRGYGPHYLVTDLGQFDFEPKTGRLRLMTIHPGVSLNYLQAKTGFEIILPEKIMETELPDSEELHLLRDVIDPLGVRTLETLSGAKRREKLREILRQEKSSFE